MATVTKAESKKMYSWWWDSHISPKNSKWLHENLTDMDSKVKQMIKLIEVDEDSFARRAEMYYKKRPELMKLVEEFYRAFRALAERYDHATGVIKQAHNTMPQAFPNQNPFIELEDESFTSPKEINSHDVDEKEIPKQMEEELDQVLSSQLQISILHSVLHDLKETNSSLLEKLFKTSKLSEELILELEYENIEQHEVVKFLSEQIRRLRMGMFQLLNVLGVDLEPKCEDNFERDQIILHHILTKLDDTRGSFCKVWDENQKLLIEKSVLETLLGQLKQELSDLKSVIKSLKQESKIGSDQLSSLQMDMRKLLQIHEQLILRIDEGNHKEKSLVHEVVNHRKKLLEMQDVCQVLEKEKCGILDENKKLEHDNSCLVVDGVSMDTLLLIFKTIVLERTEIINQLACNSYKLCDDNGVLEDKLMGLKDYVEKFDDELKEVKTENSQLRLELGRKKDELSQKEMEFSEAVTVKVDQGKQIIELSESYEKQLKESEFLRKSMQSAAAETDRRVNILRAEAGLWETVAGTFYSELQTTSFRETLFEEKFSELSQEYKHLEDENHSKDLEIAKLKEQIESLEGENSHTGLENEKNSASSREPTKDDIPNVLDIAKKLSKERSHKAVRSKGSRLCHGSGRLSRHMSSESSESTSSKRHQQLVMKDIKLDQASKVSSRDDRILELWETMDQAGSIDLTVGRENNKRKIIDRIASDVQKLTNLQTTVQDLQQKVPTKGKGMEYVRVKQQLDEAERSIAKLIGINGRLMKNADSSEIGGSERRRKVMEQARRCQEKIGRLQMEVKKIEFMLVKLDDGSGTRVMEKKTKIVLQDYLYANSRTPRRRKKGRLCGCILPRTSGSGD